MSNSTSPDEPDDESVEQLRSRTDDRQAMRVREVALERLASDLVKLNPGRLELLELEEDVLDAVRAAKTIRSAPAQQRQIRLIRNLLRDRQWAVVRAKVDSLLRHGVLPAAPLPGSPGAQGAPAAEWVVRLLGDPTVAIEELVRTNPKADRTRLRTLIRNVHKASAERRRKAEAALADCVRGLLR